MISGKAEDLYIIVAHCASAARHLRRWICREVLPLCGRRLVQDQCLPFEAVVYWQLTERETRVWCQLVAEEEEML